MCTSETDTSNLIFNCLPFVRRRRLVSKWRVESFFFCFYFANPLAGAICITFCPFYISTLYVPFQVKLVLVEKYFCIHIEPWNELNYSFTQRRIREKNEIPLFFSSSFLFSNTTDGSKMTDVQFLITRSQFEYWCVAFCDKIHVTPVWIKRASPSKADDSNFRNGFDSQRRL